MQRTDVVVVGAGPVGALLALGLAQRGHEVVLLEAESGVVPSPRAMVYYWHVLDGLDRLGVLADMDARGVRNTTFLQRVLRSGVEARIPVDPVAAITSTPYNVHLGQHEVVRIALEHLRALPNARIVFDARVTGVEQDDDGVRVTADTAEGPVVLHAAQAVGADGGRSAVRRSLGLAFEGMTWPDRFVATNLRYPFAAAGALEDASLLFDPENGCVIARIDDTGLWRWTWSEPATLPEETVAERLPGRLAALGFGDEPHEVDAFTPYRMHQRAADAMRVGRVLLAGDAAHVTNPTGGLGLTAGMYDVFSLIEPLSAVLRGESDDRGLDEWAATRLAVFRDAASPMASGIKHMVYDETDVAKTDGLVRGAGDFSDSAATLRRLTGMTVLRGAVPRHHDELEGAA